VFIPVAVKHRLFNPSDTEDLRIIEVQTGDYLEEDDIIRIEDEFDRK
jgi:mannose-6-phosphate isomerase-like protein (cupin superfamily)